MAIFVEYAEVTGAKPAVGSKCFGGRGVVPVVTIKNYAAADQDLADAFAVRLVYLYLGPAHRLADRADAVVGFEGGRRSSASFGQAIALDNRKPEPMKIDRDVFVEARAGRDRYSQAAPERVMHRCEKPVSQIDAERIAQHAVQVKHPSKKKSYSARLFFDRVEYFFVKQVPQPRHGGQDRRLEFLHRLAKFRRGKRL